MQLFSYQWVLTLTILSLASFGSARSSAAATYERIGDGDVIRFVHQPSKRTGAEDGVRATDCRANIKKVVCLVEGESGGDRPCLEGTSDYFLPFEALYDRFPEVLQKVFCSVNRIYVEKNIDSTAYAERSGKIVGIRQSLIDTKQTLGSWSTWKEQLNFGGSSLQSYEVKSDLPTFDYVPQRDGENDFLYSVIAHEFGHVLDFANGLTGEESFSGGFPAGSWGDLSWNSFSEPKEGNDFKHRSDICFYRCFNTLSRSVVPQIYEDLIEKTVFLNTYTSRSPYEDFADTFSFYLMFKNTKVNYQLDTKQGKVYDFREVMQKPQLQAKIKFIEDFLNRKEIVYP